MKLLSFLTLLLCLFTEAVLADTNPASSDSYPFYAGFTGGYGSTTWGSLVPKDPGTALSSSVPIRVSEGGKVWGFFMGYQIIPAFAFEMEYMKYPTAKLYFDEMSVFALVDTDGRTELTTQTSAIAMSAKLLIAIPKTPFKLYSRFGAAEVHRNDAIVDRWRLSPAFGAGFIYDWNPHIITEFGTEYIAGYGQSELDPAEHYIPFLYSVFLRFGVRI